MSWEGRVELTVQQQTIAESPILASLQPQGPLSPDHLRMLGEARRRAKKVRRAAGVAAFSGWTMLAFGVLSIMAGVLGSMGDLVVGAILSVLAWNELRGGAMFKQFDARAAKRLGWNQILLGTLICGYALWSMRSIANSPEMAQLHNTLNDPDAEAVVRGMGNMVIYAFFGALIAAGVIAPGLTSWYYFSRGKVVREFVAKTPPWAVEAMRQVG